MTAQSYGSTDCPNEWPVVTVPFVPLMEARPGAIEPWARPIHTVVSGTRKDRTERTKAQDGMLHMYKIGTHHSACGRHTPHGDTCGYLRFERILDHERACPKCKVEWLSHWAKRKRNEDKARYKRKTREVMVKTNAENYVKPMRWTADERRRLKEFREVASGVSAHGKRVPERGSATDHRTVR